MDSDSMVAIVGDRLSNLDDATLGHILSFLPADEAARAAVLSRRWRHVFAHVHTVSLDEPAPAPETEWAAADDCACYTPEFCECRGRSSVRDRAVAPAFVSRVSAALLGRLRRGAVPLRALRVGFAELRGRPNAGLVDMWLWYATQQQAGDELHLDLRLCRCCDELAVVCDRPYSLRREPPPVADADAETMTPLSLSAMAAIAVAAAAAAGDDDDDPDGCYVAPRSIFTCAALRTLRLGSCRLDLPSDVQLPSLDTLHLTAVTSRNRAEERLVSSCPRLAELKLKACVTVTALSVPPCTRLRTLALHCCHDLAAVIVDAAELREFEYRGAIPGPSFLTLHGGGPLGVSSCTLDFCGGEALELSGLVDMLRLFAGVERLHLTSARLGFGAAMLSLPTFPAFAKLRHLELIGMLPEDDATAIDAVAKILERTPNLEILSLFFMPEPVPENEHYGYGCGEDLLHGHKLKYDERTSFATPDIDLHCLRERVKEINLVHYQGGMAQRMLAKFLLCNAPAVQEVCGEFASGPLFLQIKLMEEIKGWVRNRSANMMFF